MRVFLIVWLPPAVLIYLVACFVVWDFDVSTWGKSGRTLLAFMQIMWLLTALMLLEQIKEKTKQVKQ